METVHLRLAEIGLRAAARYGFALAGGYAVQAHGILDRPSEDVDLFNAWERRDELRRRWMRSLTETFVRARGDRSHPARH